MANYIRLRRICLVAPESESVIADIAGIMALQICCRDSNVAKCGLVKALLPVLLELVSVRGRPRHGKFQRKQRAE